MLEQLPYDALSYISSFLDINSAKSLRLVNKNLKCLTYELIIKKVRVLYIFMLVRSFRYFRNAIVQISCCDRFNVILKKPGCFYFCLGGFEIDVSRPYRDWWIRTGRFDYGKRFVSKKR